MGLERNISASFTETQKREESKAPPLGAGRRSLSPSGLSRVPRCLWWVQAGREQAPGPSGPRWTRRPTGRRRLRTRPGPWGGFHSRQRPGDLESGHARCPESTWSKQPTATFHLPQRAGGGEITGAVEDGGSPCLGELSGASVSGASLRRGKASGHCCRLASFSRKPGRKRHGAKCAASWHLLLLV